MSAYEYDLAVIGSGPAGEKGAAQVAYFGHRVVLIEKDMQLGGACINTGTLPSKTLRESALYLSGFKSRQLYGIETSLRQNITLKDFMHRKEVVQDREHERVTTNLDRHHITRLRGTARLVDAHTVCISRPDGSERRITAEIILVATGSKPHRPSDVPFNPDNVFDSDTILEMHELPRAMVIIGGGVIGCEYACIFAALGIEVTLVEGRDRLLPFIDYEIADILTHRMREMEIELCLSDGLASMRLEGNLVRSKLKRGGELLTDAALYVAGRSGQTEALGLEGLGIKVGPRGHVEVDPVTYQTAAPNIYACGDVIGFPALASTSMEQGRIAMCHAFGLNYKSRLAEILPYGIYTIPELSSVGESEQSCQQKRIDYVVGRTRFASHARGQIIGDTEGMIKLVFEVPSGKLLGTHVIGELASELVHIGMGCMHFGGDIDFFIQSVFNYPTLSDGYKYAAYDALGALNRLRKAREAAPVVPTT